VAQNIENLQTELGFLASIEPAARQELAEELGELGGQALAIQQAAAPYRTGRLRNALTVAQAINGMRVQVGYPDLKGGRDPRFYAIFQESGVAAGQKMVTRLNRRNGRTVQKGKVKVYPRTTYLLKWKAREAHPFVHIEPRIEALLAAVQERFWDRALARVGD
jgi:hypothetical protein